jgi:hypothetical protein
MSFGQSDLLNMLSCYHYLTTREICEQAAVPRSKRATEQMLARLQQAGLVAACPLHPEQGRASPYAWRLLPKGAAAIGIPYHDPLRPPPTATPNQVAVLQLLAKMKQLTTTQIWQHLHADKARTYTRHLLARLEAHSFITSADLYPEQGSASEHYWRLRPQGCAVLHLPFDSRYTRRPSREVIAHREAQLTLEQQVSAAGWELLEPVVYNTAHPRPAETPQARLLIAAVLAAERETLTALLAQGIPPEQLQHRIALWQGGHVGAVVPPFVNDYIAYPADQLQHTTVFILHPWQAGPGFWTRRARPGEVGKHSLDRNARQPRVERYRRLALVLPVVALFTSREAASYYARFLQPARLRCAAVADLAAEWERLTAPPPRR